MLNAILIKKLYRRKCDNLFRSKTIWDGKPNLNFSNNDYLGLANHPKVIQACVRGAKRYGVGSRASQLIGGYSTSHHALEEELAKFLGYEKVLLFSTGYMANTGVIDALFNEKKYGLFVDRLCHASIIDGIKHTSATHKRYQHLNIKDLEKRLQTTTTENKIIISEGVFSMNGDIAPLQQLTLTAKKNKATLMLDDAHGIGVLGSSGKGAMECCGVTPADAPILVGTFGKAFGTFGAFVASNRIIIESLIQTARTYIYTTAPPVPIVEATRASLKLLQQEVWRRNYLKKLIGKFKQKAKELQLPFLVSDTPIQPLIINDAKRAISIAHHLKQKGILVGLVRPPTVPVNTSRLRITLNINHTEQDIDYLLEKLHGIFKL